MHPPTFILLPHCRSRPPFGAASGAAATPFCSLHPPPAALANVPFSICTFLRHGINSFSLVVNTHTLLLHEKGCGLSPHAAFGERFRPGAENRTTNAKLAIAPKARCSAFPDSQRPVTLAPPCEATQRLTGANAAVLWSVLTVSAVPVVARRRLRRDTADAGCTIPSPLGWGEYDNAGCRFSSARSA